MDEKLLVFVYGTLRQGFGNHGLMKGATFRGYGQVPGALVLSGWLPMAMRALSGRVKGEVYELQGPKQMEDLDLLEGHPNWYRRELQTVRMEDDSELQAWVYYMPLDEIPSNHKILHSGDYMEAGAL